MAGFFGFFDYTKPGPGVPKEQPKKAGIVVFFEVFARKFWNLIKVNLIFNVFNLLTLFFLFIAVQFLFPSQLFEDFELDFILRFSIGSVFVTMPILTTGPVQAGMTYILRNYSREEHAFIWWDFKEHALKNLKQSLIICAIDFFAVIIMGISLNFYGAMASSSIMYTAALGILILVLILFFMMHLFIYPMMVTFKLTVKQIYKNAMIFSIIKFLPNLGILALCAVLTLVTFINPLIGIFLFVFITNSLIGLIINFYANPVLSKYMIKDEET